MNLQTWLIFLHLLGAVVWLGGGAALALIGIRVRRSGERTAIVEFATTFRYLGLRALMPAVVVVLVTGLLMVNGPGWQFSQPWILTGLALFVAAFLIGALYLSRIAVALERAVSEPGRDVRESTALIGQWLIGYGIVLFILVGAVWDMVFKPF